MVANADACIIQARAGRTEHVGKKMGHTWLAAGFLAVAIGTTGGAPAERGTESKEPAMSSEKAIPLQLGGVGGVYLLASPGELVVEVEKRDLNNGRGATHLRAILFGPDRGVLDEQWIPEDGVPRGKGRGPAKRLRLAANVPRTGVYGLNITVTTDRYGTQMVWGFRTNCPKYLVETSRGHKDIRHEEPIVLRNAGVPGDVCFTPRAGAFSLEVEGLAEGCEALALHNVRGELIETLRVDGRKASHSFPADAHRDAVPWRLHFPKHHGVVHIDGVTRWDKKDRFPNLGLWTPEAGSWFPLLQNRWLLTPYSRTVYGTPGAQVEVPFRVHNSGPEPKAVRLTLEFQQQAGWPVELSRERVTLEPGKASEVVLRCPTPEDEATRTFHLRATPEDGSGFTTYSTIRLRGGPAPAAAPVPIPIVLKPYRHENEQFGYLPDYPVLNQMYFDPANRPFVSLSGTLAAWRDSDWVMHDLRQAVRGGPSTACSARTSKVAFDRDGGVYLLATRNRQSVYLHSTDGGESFAATTIPGGGGFDIEQFSGHNVPADPPPFVRFTRTAKDPKLRWRSLNDLALFTPTKAADGGVVVGEPVVISRMCIGLSAHSGIPSSVVSRGSKVHVAWGEATDPKEKVPGVPTYVATYDRATKKLGEPVLIGHGPPANDVHNSPCITMDSKGHLHVLVGTHGRAFKYARSLKPNDAYGGWTEAEDVGPGLRQTYVGLVCDQTDTLHLVFRLWQNAGDYFPASSYAALAHMRKRPGEPWSEARPLLIAPFSEYSIYYHRLTIDRKGRLFLSYDYWSTFWFYRTDHWGKRRALLMSADGGDSWKLAEGTDLRP